MRLVGGPRGTLEQWWEEQMALQSRPLMVVSKESVPGSV